MEVNEYPAEFFDSELRRQYQVALMQQEQALLQEHGVLCEVNQQEHMLRIQELKDNIFYQKIVQQVQEIRRMYLELQQQ